MTMAPLQRFHQLWSINLFDDVYAETDEDFVDLQVATVPLQDHYPSQQPQHSLDTKHSLPSSTTTKKSVSFSLSNDICIIDSKQALSEEEKANIWYDKKDFHRFKDSCRRIIEWVSSSQNQFSFFGPWDSNQEDDEDTTKYCMRGLERHTRDGNAKYIQRITARGNDLYILRMTGANSEEVATIMVQHSLACVAEAHERARQDALAAWRYQHEPSLELVPTSTTTNFQPKLGPDTWASLLPTIRTIRDQCATTT